MNIIIAGNNIEITKEIAIILNSLSKRIMIFNDDPDKLREIISTLNFEKVYASGIKVDYSTITSIEKAVLTTLNKFGKIDILINAIEFINIDLFHKLNLETIDKINSINFLAPLYLTHYILNGFHGMIEKRSGKIIYLLNSTEDTYIKNEVLFNSTQIALKKFSSTLAFELQKYNISTYTIRSNQIITNFTSENITDNLSKITDMTPGERLVNKKNTISNKKFNSPKDIAKAVSLLCNNNVKNISGTNIKLI